MSHHRCSSCGGDCSSCRWYPGCRSMGLNPGTCWGSLPASRGFGLRHSGSRFGAFLRLRRERCCLRMKAGACSFLFNHLIRLACPSGSCLSCWQWMLAFGSYQTTRCRLVSSCTWGYRLCLCRSQVWQVWGCWWGGTRRTICSIRRSGLPRWALCWYSQRSLK